MSVDGFHAVRCLLRRCRSRRRAGPSICVGFGPGERFRGWDRLVGADSRRSDRRNQGRLRKRTRSIKPFATHGTPARSSFRAERKRKPPNRKVRRLSFSLFCWWLCSIAMPKQRQAVIGGTKTGVQKPVPAIPTPVIHRIYGVKYVPSRPHRTTVFAPIFPVQQ